MEELTPTDFLDAFKKIHPYMYADPILKEFQQFCQKLYKDSNVDYVD